MDPKNEGIVDQAKHMAAGAMETIADTATGALAGLKASAENLLGNTPEKTGEAQEADTVKPSEDGSEASEPNLSSVKHSVPEKADDAKEPGIQVQGAGDVAADVADETGIVKEVLVDTTEEVKT